MSADKYKAQASRLAEHLAVTYGWKLTHHKALNAVAAAAGARNWNTLQATEPREFPTNVDWGHQAVVRWAGQSSPAPLLRQMVDSRRAHYLANANTACRIERANLGRIPGGLLAQDEDGKVALTEIHREEGSSFAVVSLAGAGKSHVMSELMLDTLRRGGVVHSLDAGNSHRKLCALHGGRQVTLEKTQARGLNPFQHYAGADFIRDLQEPLTEVLLELFATGVPAQAVQHLEAHHAEIGDAVARVWREQRQTATLGEALRILARSANDVVRAAADAVLKTWADLGPWVDGDSSALQSDLNHEFVVIDTDSLLQTPDLYNAVTMLLALHGSSVLRSKGEDRPRLLVIEDADWYLRHMTRHQFWRQLQKQLDRDQCGLGLTVAQLREDHPQTVTRLVECSLTLFLGRGRPDDLSRLMELEPWNKVRGLARAMWAAFSARSQGRNQPPPFVVLQYKLSPKVIHLELDAYSRLLLSMRPQDVVKKNEVLLLPESEKAVRLLEMSRS